MNFCSIMEYIEHNARILQGKGFVSLPLETEAAAFFLKTNHAGHQINIFDCGANIGNWTTSLIGQLAKYDLHNYATFYLFEPQKKNVEILKKKFENSSNVIIEGLGVSDSTRKTTLYTHEIGSGMGSLYKRTLSNHNIEFDKKEMVSLVALDEYIENHGIGGIDYLKLDVEGHEMHALEGCIHSIEKNIIGAIQFEFGAANIDSRTYFRDYYQFLKINHFDLYRISPLKNHPIESYQETDECFVNACNYLAVSSHKYFNAASSRQFVKLMSYVFQKMALRKIDFT